MQVSVLWKKEGDTLVQEQNVSCGPVGQISRRVSDAKVDGWIENTKSRVDVRFPGNKDSVFHRERDPNPRCVFLFPKPRRLYLHAQVYIAAAQRQIRIDRSRSYPNPRTVRAVIEELAADAGRRSEDAKGQRLHL